MIFFPEILHDFFCLKRLRDFFVQRGSVIFFVLRSSVILFCPDSLRVTLKFIKKKNCGERLSCKKKFVEQEFQVKNIYR